MVAEVVVVVLGALSWRLLGIWADTRTRRWADVDGLRERLAAVESLSERVDDLETAWEIRRTGM